MATRDAAIMAPASKGEFHASGLFVYNRYLLSGAVWRDEQRWKEFWDWCTCSRKRVKINCAPVLSSQE
jgi:hypothetical protein